MIPIIAGFLIGAVLSWGFRVWVLMPGTLVAIVALTSYDLTAGTGAFSVIGHCVLIGLALQLGYAFGLLTQHIIIAARAKRAFVVTERRPFTQA